MNGKDWHIVHHPDAVLAAIGAELAEKVNHFCRTVQAFGHQVRIVECSAIPEGHFAILDRDALDKLLAIPKSLPQR